MTQQKRFKVKKEKILTQPWVLKVGGASIYMNLKILNFNFYLKVFSPIKDSIPSFVTQCLELGHGQGILSPPPRAKQVKQG